MGMAPAITVRVGHLLASLNEPATFGDVLGSFMGQGLLHGAAAPSPGLLAKAQADMIPKRNTKAAFENVPQMFRTSIPMNRVLQHTITGVPLPPTLAPITIGRIQRRRWEDDLAQVRAVR